MNDQKRRIAAESAGCRTTAGMKRTRLLDRV